MNLREGECMFMMVWLMHYNARPHAARLTVELLEGYDWDMCTYPPHSPDSTPTYHQL